MGKEIKVWYDNVILTVSLFIFIVLPIHVLIAEVTEERLLKAFDDPNNWLMYARDYRSWRYSQLDQINASNVKKLVPKWTFQTGVLGGFECTPLVVDGVMYITTPSSHIYAIDARTGQEIWRYDYQLPEGLSICCDVVNRGAAVYGDKVYWVTLDAHLLALDAKTGKVLWDAIVGDPTNAESLTVAPLVAKGKVIVGISGAEYGIRGFIEAHDANTGERIWRFYTVPEKGEPGGETWEGDSWMTGGGSAWVTGSYDPELNLIYWGVGNPGPDWNGEVREGDNLYTDSVVALDADTGKLVWYFQNTPHDVWDWDGVSEPILVDLPINGKLTKTLLQVNRNGFFYALDRTNGKFLFAKPYCQVTWLEKMDENGRPTPKKESLTSEEGVWVCPGVPGGKNWPPAAYSPQTNLVYVPVIENCGKYFSSKVFYRKGLPYTGSGMTADESSEGMWGHVTAIEASSGNIAWQHKTKLPMAAGMLTTAGGLVFSGDPEGNAFALDAKTGKLLWSFQTGSGVHSSPMTYMIDGKQYIVLPSGWGGAMPEPKGPRPRRGDTLYVFGLFEE